jgi:hypothetical protein
MASGTRGSSTPRFSATGRATSLQHVLKNVLECDLTSPLYQSVLQHFGGDEDKFNIIDYFLCDQMYFENLHYSETVIDNPKEKDPAKVITRVERYHVPKYLRARCIFFNKFLEDKKNDGEDFNYESFYMVTSAQLFVGTKTHTADLYPIKSDKQFVNTLLDNITQHGAPTKLIRDCAQVEISECVKQVLQPLHISTWQSELHQQHQNPAERQYQNIKQLCNTILDRSGAPAYTWLLCLMYVCFLLNNTWCKAVDDIPIRMSPGSTNDISPLLCFHFWEPVYYKLDDSDFPSDSREKRGHFVGISESVRHAMTFKILTDDTLKVIH